MWGFNTVLGLRFKHGKLLSKCIIAQHEGFTGEINGKQDVLFTIVNKITVHPDIKSVELLIF